MRQVNLTIGNDPYLLEHVTQLVTHTGRPFRLDDTDHGWRYHIAYPDHPPGPNVDVVLLTTAGILTGDEPDLWQLIAQATPNHRIAHTLGYSTRTLHRILPSFYQLIGATNKPHATLLCSRAVPYRQTRQ